MTRRLSRIKESLRRSRHFAAGVLIGSAASIPAFAANQFSLNDIASKVPLNDVSVPLLVGSVVLLVIAVVLKATRRKPVRDGAVRGELSEGIGQYRLQLGRSRLD
jgi:hypothetical protein